MGDSAAPFALAGLSQHSDAAPVPIGGTYIEDNLSVLFDRPLLPGPLDPSNWTARWDNIHRLATSAIAVGSQVNLVTEVDEASPGTAWVSYFGIPADLRSAGGTAAAPFIEFSLEAE